MNQLELTGPLGQKIMVEFTDYPHSLALMREWGARGFTSGAVPHGGYQLPYCMADSFDWALIGARKRTNPEGEEVILHQGKAYRRRELDANEKKNMPAVIKYSRGAKNSDPEHLKEGEDGGFQYVTLAVFRGNAKAIPDYEAPRQGQQQRPPQQQQDTEPEAPQEAPVTVKVLGEVFAQKLDERMTAFPQGTRFEQKNHVKLAAHIVKREITTLADLTEEEAKHVSQVCESEKRKAEESAA